MERELEQLLEREVAARERCIDVIGDRSRRIGGADAGERDQAPVTTAQSRA